MRVALASMSASVDLDGGELDIFCRAVVGAVLGSENMIATGAVTVGAATGLDCDCDGDAGYGGVLLDAVGASFNVYASNCSTSCLVSSGLSIMSCLPESSVA